MDIGGVLRPNWGALKDQVRYGAQGQIANLAQLFNYRLDQFLVAGGGHGNRIPVRLWLCMPLSVDDR